jgi:hypothetical protein
VDELWQNLLGQNLKGLLLPEKVRFTDSQMTRKHIDLSFRQWRRQQPFGTCSQIRKTQFPHRSRQTALQVPPTVRWKMQPDSLRNKFTQLDL